MKNLTLLCSLFLATLSYGQQSGEIVIFSETGEPVYVTLNGIRQNYQPETNVKIQGLAANWYSCKIESFDNRFNLEKNILVKRDTLITYRIAEKKGSYKLRFFTEVPLQAAPKDETQSVVVYHPTETVPPPVEVVETTTVTTTTVTETNGGNTDSGQTQNTAESVSVNINVGSTGMNTDVNVTETGSVSTGVNTGSESVNVNMSVTGTGISTDMDVDGGAYTEESNVTYTETTTVTTTTSSTSSGTVTNTNPVVTETPVATSTCAVVDGSGMKKAVSAIQNESFEEDQMRVAKQFAKNKCLTVNQIKEIAVLFSFSEGKQTFVQYAYDNCLNKDDYYELMDIFDFSSDKEDLEEFLNSK